MSDSAEVRVFSPSSSTADNAPDVTGDIYEGLTRSPKDISPWPKYLYDSRGSELFEEITEQPEYYQTRTELSMLEKLSGDIVSGGDFGELVELGSGSSSKTRAIIDAMLGSSDTTISYVPLDVSESAVEEGTESLGKDYQGLSVSGYVGDFDGAVGEFLASLPEGNGNRLVIFLGGTIGNFTPLRREGFLEGVRYGLRRGDRFLVGVDLVKDITTLESAYDDSAGVTAAFNRNVLSAINDRIGSDFDPLLFDHKAIYNKEETRVEMWLISTRDQEINLGEGGLSVHFSKGEGVRTEISTKFTRETASNMFEGSGLELVELYTDRDSLFGLALGKPE